MRQPKISAAKHYWPANYRTPPTQPTNKLPQSMTTSVACNWPQVLPTINYAPRWARWFVPQVKSMPRNSNWPWRWTFQQPLAVTWIQCPPPWAAPTLATSKHSHGWESPLMTTSRNRRTTAQFRNC